MTDAPYKVGDVLVDYLGREVELTRVEPVVGKPYFSLSGRALNFETATATIYIYRPWMWRKKPKENTNA